MEQVLLLLHIYFKGGSWKTGETCRFAFLQSHRRSTQPTSASSSKPPNGEEKSLRGQELLPKMALEVVEGRFIFGQSGVSQFPPFGDSLLIGCWCPDSHASRVIALDFSARKPNVSSRIRSRRWVVWFGAHVVSVTSSVGFLVAAARSHQWGRCMTAHCCPLLAPSRHTRCGCGCRRRGSVGRSWCR